MPRRLFWPALFVAAVSGCFLTSKNAHHQSGNPYQGGVADVPGDLPCEVVSALVTCQACHGPAPSGGAPIPLATRVDLMAAARATGETAAERAIARMSGDPTQMPPLPSASSAQSDIDTMRAWVAAGYPTGTCSTMHSVCTSELAGVTGESSRMRPGEACLACHRSNEGPREAFMGTLYPTLHEPSDCQGADAQTYAGAQVVVTDALGKELAMSPNTAGNFMGSPSSFAMPFTAKVRFEGREVAMTTPQTNGDCNACHTETGEQGAPGRIMLP